MQKLLQLLQDGEFHSGESLGRAIGLSRAGVWKRLQGLEAEFGVAIFRVRGRGYRLSSPISLLRAGDLSESLAPYGWEVVLAESVGSTNAEALRLLSAGADAPLRKSRVVAAGGVVALGSVLMVPIFTTVWVFGSMVAFIPLRV